MRRFHEPFEATFNPGQADPAVVEAVGDHVANLVLASVRQSPGWLLSFFVEMRDDPCFAPVVSAVGGRRVGPRSSPLALLQRVNDAVEAGRLGSRSPRLPQGVLGRNLGVLAAIVGLDEIEQAVLQFLVLVPKAPALQELSSATRFQGLEVALQLIGAAIARDAAAVRLAVGPDRRLMGAGLITFESEADRADGYYPVADWVLEALRDEGLDRARLMGRMLPEAPRAVVGADDFGHHAATFGATLQLLRQALLTRRPGVNVLLYGPAGTGKTEFAKCLAAELSVPLHLAGAVDGDAGPATPRDRVASLRLGHRLLGGGGALLLLDEAEDVFPEASMFGPKRVGTKQGLTLLLEQNPVPTVWITNSIDGMDEAIRRRFAFAVQFEPAGYALRRKLWARHTQGSALAPSDLDDLARRFQVGPGLIATAASSAGLLAGGSPDRAAIEQVLVPLVTLFDGAPPRTAVTDSAETYVGAAVSASTDVSALLDRLSGWKPDGRPGLTILLHGPPGTGKSAWVHALARRMGRRVVVRSGSDLLSMWVGGSEKNIAAAFAEAERDDAVLLLDEVDSLISDRRGHVRTFESSQTNEFLQQLERFRGVVACTTNLLATVDPAALRRFVVKVGFEHLGPDQALAAFDAIFGPLVAVPERPGWREALRRELGRMPNLAPGDFAAVARRLRVLGTERSTLDELAEELRVELAVKEGAQRPAGFG